MTQLRNVPTMVVVDITNLYFTAQKKWNRKLNYELLSKKILDENDNVGVMNGYASFRRHYAPFLSVLTNLGFTVQHKLIDSFLPHVSWTAKITIDCLDRSDIQKYIFLSSDYGLISLYEYLTKHNRWVEVWAPVIPLAVQQAANDVFEFGETFCANAIAKSKKIKTTDGPKPG
jgi:hypothetical protein